MGANFCKDCLQDYDEGEGNTDNILDALREEDNKKRGSGNMTAHTLNQNTQPLRAVQADPTDRGKKISAIEQQKIDKLFENDEEIIQNHQEEGFLSRDSLKDLELLDISAISFKGEKDEEAQNPNVDPAIQPNAFAKNKK